jgi:hypothetical protein
VEAGESGSLQELLTVFPLCWRHEVTAAIGRFASSFSKFKGGHSLLTHDTQRDLIAFGLYEQFAFHAQTDGDLARDIAANGGMTVAVFESFAHQYRVLRTCRRGRDKREALVKLLNDAARDFRGDLKTRAAIVIHVASQLRQEGLTHHDFVSGASKAMCFLCLSDDWTPFDGQAAKALGIKGTIAAERAQAYYKRLQEAGWTEACREVVAALPSSCGFNGARVLDKALWLAGSGTHPTKLPLARQSARERVPVTLLTAADNAVEALNHSVLVKPLIERLLKKDDLSG